ncbi:TorF family putative porin [Roseateles sp. BYS180W]|uniref:TorF family putative porin n=1 Tax=Roseateles rivi TaxID=3299028 RepID=A0ABW7FQS8_9BURK
MNSIKKHWPMALGYAAVAATAVLAVKPAEAAEDYSLSANAGVVSDYRYRGISQTRLKPAVQAGVDFAHASGTYVGVWASSIKWTRDIPEGGGKAEIDIYAGYKHKMDNGMTLDLGGLYYWYPSSHLVHNTDYVDADTFELYTALSWGPLTLKYSHALTPLFGLTYSPLLKEGKGTRNSGYWDVSGNFELPYGLILTPHIGHQRVAGTLNPQASYTDYSLTLSKTYKGFTPSLTLVGTNADQSYYVPGTLARSTQFLGKRGVVAGLKYTY